MSQEEKLSTLIINTIRTLGIDAIQKANSGHPGALMALAPVAFTVWDKFIRHNPQNPEWPNRDRFILSAGHASMLLYGILHIMGYDITLSDIKNFRQLHSITPGHPEYHLIPGVETTTGPLGQGAGCSVGMAIAEKWLASYFNRPGYDIIDYNIFVIVSDGDLMEGVSSEAASLAGHLGLGNLVWIYDNNHITIEGSTKLTFSEDVAARFRAYNWFVQKVNDANDLKAIECALKNAKTESSHPSLIIVDSHIAYGSPNKQDTSAAHGSPLGEDEIKAVKRNYGWDPEAKFLIPTEIEPYRQSVIARGMKFESEWNKKFASYEIEYPELANQFMMMLKRELPTGWEKDLPLFAADVKGTATRNSSGKVLNAVAKHIPWLIGGSADLAESTKTLIDGAKSFANGVYDGRNFHFGIREHAMGAIANGMALSKIRPYTATFLVFSDYMRPSIRLAALMSQPVIYIFTHDSIRLGEDGPTHQPIEHLAALRAIPNLDVIRPADANEVSSIWKYVLAVTDHPIALILSRQSIPTIDRKIYSSADGALRGAYILADCDSLPDVMLIGTGSEVQLCLDVHEVLMKEGVKSRVVSMPCWSLFDWQSKDYREKVLPSIVRTRIAVEAGSTMGWERYLGCPNKSRVIGMEGFGASAPDKELYREFGFTVERIVRTAKEALNSTSVHHP
ncbi:MAG: transketolase [candidate division Zixibacteria bacterium CG_4_9_14_3_um_filter_46_8]|nr:MAG: transketolase [candidate division Zixibacteria bacterium CG_4_9_14_3_um_filter_46_8]